MEICNAFKNKKCLKNCDSKTACFIFLLNNVNALKLDNFKAFGPLMKISHWENASKSDFFVKVSYHHALVLLKNWNIFADTKVCTIFIFTEDPI